MASEAQTDRAFVGSIPEIYDRVMVPLIFEPYARDLTERVARLSPARILETAAGTGGLTRALLERLGADAEIVVTDLNAPMLEVAQRRSPDARARWQQADALALPFADASFDLLACQFGAMFFPDRVRGYAEARRVLAENGRFLFSVWGSLADNVFAEVVTQALAGLFPADPPAFLARGPHGYADAERIRQDLVAAGFADVDIQTVDAVSRAASAHDAATGYCQGTPLRGEIDARSAAANGRPDIEEVTQAVAEALAGRFGTGPIEGPIRALVITAAR